MITYRFKVEFFQSSTDIYRETDKIYEIISSNLGVHLNGSVTSQWVTDTAVSYFNTKLQIFNLGFNFNQKLKWGNRVVISYETTFSKGWKFLISGIMGIPLKKDLDNGDNVLNLDIFQVSRNAFLRNTLNQNFQNMTIIQSLQKVLGNRLGKISISQETQNKIIKGSFFCNTIEEFLNRIQSYGGFSIKTNLGSSINALTDSNLFNVQERSSLISSFDPQNIKFLEKFGLHFIPEESQESNNELNITYKYWNPIILLTNGVSVGDSVFFKNQLGKAIQGIVQTVSYSFSTRGACISRLRILDLETYIGNNST